VTAAWLTSRPVAVFTASAVAAAVSAVVTYRVTSKQLEKKYSDISSAEIAEARQFYDQKYKTGVFASPVDLAAQIDEEVADISDGLEEIEGRAAMVEAAADIASKHEYTNYRGTNDVRIDEAPRDEEQEIHVRKSIRDNVFDKRDESRYLDEEAEAAKRALNKPYIIDEHTYLMNEDDLDVRALMWFEQDEVMVDEVETPLTAEEEQHLVDLDNLRFGVGSDDRNVVYIHNPELNILVEVTKSNGSFATEVNGEPFDPSSHKPRVVARSVR
jgi:hypothetical protein